MPELERESYSGSPSTTWTWKRVKVRRPAEGQQQREPKARHIRGLLPRNPREPLTVKISYRGGAEAWYEVHARGVVIRRPGHVALHDLMREINNAAG